MSRQRFIGIGDSRWASGGNNVAYAQRAALTAYMALTGVRPAYFNYAVPGMKLADIVNNYATLIRANTRRNDIVLCEAGINDLRTGASVSTVVSLYQTLGALTQSDGLDLVAVTPYPGQYTTDPANVSADAISVANALRNLTYCTTQVHLIDHPDFNSILSRTNPANYNLDQLHLTDSGYDKKGLFIAPAIQPLIRPGNWS
jgi:lysophospholipase L1-like esterase